MPSFVTSRQNSHVRALRAALRGHSDGDTAAMEGWTLLREALAAKANGLQVQQVYLRQDRQSLAAQLPPETDVLLLSAEAFESAAVTEHSQGVAAMLLKPRMAYQPKPGDLVLVAAGLQDPGNLGTLIRSAEALGAAAVVLAEQTADPWNGKALRASAGSVFRFALPRWSDALLTSMREGGLRLLAAVPNSHGAVDATETDLRGGCALFVGNEGKGLSPAMLSVCDERITLAMHGRTESLNAAVAGSLLLYEASRQRRVGA